MRPFIRNHDTDDRLKSQQRLLLRFGVNAVYVVLGTQDITDTNIVLWHDARQSCDINLIDELKADVDRVVNCGDYYNWYSETDADKIIDKYYPKDDQ